MLTIVSGFQRCGSSLLMQMLQAGGAPVFHDPEMGYPSFETFCTSQTPDDRRWLSRMDGRAIKWLEPRHTCPPVDTGLQMRVIWMKRDYVEQAKSAVKFMQATGFPSLPKDTAKRFAQSYRKDEQPSLDIWAKRGAVHVQNFEHLLENPQQAVRDVCRFLAASLNETAMAAVVRERPPTRLPYMLEVELMERTTL